MQHDVNLVSLAAHGEPKANRAIGTYRERLGLQLDVAPGAGVALHRALPVGGVAAQVDAALAQLHSFIKAPVFVRAAAELVMPDVLARYMPSRSSGVLRGVLQIAELDAVNPGAQVLAAALQLHTEVAQACALEAGVLHVHIARLVLRGIDAHAPIADCVAMRQG